MVNDRFIIGALLLPFVMVSVVLLIPMRADKTSFSTNIYHQILTYHTDIPRVLEIKEETTPIERSPFILKRFVPTKTKKTPPSRKQEIKEKVPWDVKLLILGKERRYAIVNNQFVREGDPVNGFIVKKIDLEYVILTKGKIREIVYIGKQGQGADGARSKRQKKSEKGR